MMLKNKEIKNIIFDLGGVLLNIDYHLTSAAFRQLGVLDFDDLYSQAKQGHLFDDLEVGKIGVDDFCSHFSKNNGLTKSDVIGAWNAMLLDFPLHRLSLLKSLKSDYRIFLLSNTNEIHIAAFNEILKNTFGENPFGDLFEEFYYSSDIGLRKPNSDCFEFVLDQNDLVPEQTLFIDDSVQHVVGAEQVGINSVLLEDDIISLFPDRVQPKPR